MLSYKAFVCCFVAINFVINVNGYSVDFEEKCLQCFRDQKHFCGLPTQHEDKTKMKEAPKEDKWHCVDENTKRCPAPFHKKKELVKTAEQCYKTCDKCVAAKNAWCQGINGAQCRRKTLDKPNPCGAAEAYAHDLEGCSKLKPSTTSTTTSTPPSRLLRGGHKRKSNTGEPGGASHSKPSTSTSSNGPGSFPSGAESGSFSTTEKQPATPTTAVLTTKAPLIILPTEKPGHDDTKLGGGQEAVTSTKTSGIDGGVAEGGNGGSGDNGEAEEEGGEAEEEIAENDEKLGEAHDRLKESAISQTGTPAATEEKGSSLSSILIGTGFCLALFALGTAVFVQGLKKSDFPLILNSIRSCETFPMEEVGESDGCKDPEVSPPLRDETDFTEHGSIVSF